MFWGWNFQTFRFMKSLQKLTIFIMAFPWWPSLFYCKPNSYFLATISLISFWHCNWMYCCVLAFLNTQYAYRLTMYSTPDREHSWFRCWGLKTLAQVWNTKSPCGTCSICPSHSVSSKTLWVVDSNDVEEAKLHHALMEETHPPFLSLLLSAFWALGRLKYFPLCYAIIPQVLWKQLL